MPTVSNDTVFCWENFFRVFKWWTRDIFIIWLKKLKNLSRWVKWWASGSFKIKLEKSKNFSRCIKWWYSDSSKILMKNQKTFLAAHNGCSARIVRLIENIFPFDQTVVKRQCNNREERMKFFSHGTMWWMRLW